jgi:hypothetical protein
LVLVFHQEYDDGLFGRLGMAMITFVAVARILKFFDGIPDYVSPNMLVLYVGLSMFFGRHTYRFLRRATWKGPNWYNQHNSGKSLRWPPTTT